jgi:hypothetical protein
MTAEQVMARYPTLTPIQRKMLVVFSDGMPHTKTDLAKCLNDDLACETAVNYHLGCMRKVLRMLGEDIICEWHQHKFCFRQVVLLYGKAHSVIS